MKTYKGLRVFVEKIEEDIEKIQHRHCENSLCNWDNCNECLFYKFNLEQFKEWYNKKD